METEASAVVAAVVAAVAALLDAETRVCSAPLGNLNRFSDTFFFKQGRSVVVDGTIEIVADAAVGVVLVVADFSTLPWLSLRSGGGSHFLPLNTRLLFPGELVFAATPLLPSFATILSVSSSNTDAATF